MSEDRASLELELGQSANVDGLKVTFAGAAPVQYGSKPPAGCILLDFERDGEETRETVMDRDWRRPLEVFGISYEVLNEPELQPKVCKLRIG